jgi:uncharacterized protein (TIGR00369 family)
MNLQPNSSTCFACGINNPAGLQLRFQDNGRDEVYTNFTLDLKHESYPGVAHGGVVAAILDEVGGRTNLIGQHQRFFMTARLDVRYRKPVPVAVPLRAVGRLLKRSGRRARAHAEICTLDSQVLAEANLLFTDIPPGQLDSEKAIRDFGWRLYE